MLKVIKENKMILLIPIIVLLNIIVMGCSSKSEGHTEKRFVKIDDGYNCTIVYDRKTKVQYAISDSITVLVILWVSFIFAFVVIDLSNKLLTI